MSDDRLPSAGDLAAVYLPHGTPFLLLDRIVAIEGSTGRFTKCLASDDPFLGPGGELSPVLIVEAMAQGAGIVLARQEPALRKRGAMLAAIDRCHVTGTARAGDRLEVEVTIVRRYAAMARIRGRAFNGEHECATAALTLAFAPEDPPPPAG